MNVVVIGCSLPLIAETLNPVELRTWEELIGEPLNHAHVGTKQVRILLDSDIVVKFSVRYGRNTDAWSRFHVFSSNVEPEWPPPPLRQIPKQDIDEETD